MSEPVPVIFSLSSWSDKNQSLFDWLESELTLKYQIPSSIGRRWLKAIKFFLCLTVLTRSIQKIGMSVLKRLMHSVEKLV